MKFFWFDLIVYLFCRTLTKWRRKSNPGRLGGKRERFHSDLPSPQRNNMIALSNPL